MPRVRSKRTSEPHNDPVASELTQIKRLLVLLLMKGGATQQEIALALQVDQSHVSRLLPSSKVERFKVE